MEIHTCKNCEFVDEVLSKKLKLFELLSAENISLHSALTSAREQNEALLKKIANLRSISINDHNEIVKLFLETETRKLPVVSKSTTEIHSKDEEDNIRKLLSLIECQKKIYEEEIGIILNEKEVLLKEFDKQQNKLRDHVKILLEELNLCRQQLFRQKKENLIEKQLFRDVINDLKSENKKVIERISKESLYLTYDKAKNKMENLIRSKNEQLKRQDDLINILRHQQNTVNLQIEDTIKSKNVLINQFQAKILKVREDYKRLQHKYYTLERRRRLDAEGFHTDVKLLRNDLKKLSKTNLTKETAEMYNNKLHELDQNITYLYTN